MQRNITAALLAIAVGALASGCRIDADLDTTPASVGPGDPVTYDVSLRNRTNCPLGGVVGLVIPLIPRDVVEDPEINEQLDAFCAGEEIEIAPGQTADCQLVDGDLVCTVDAAGVGGISSSTESVVTEVDGADDVVCEASGTTMTCTVPESVLVAAQQAQEDAVTSSQRLVPPGLVCFPVIGPLVGCVPPTLGTRLDPGETRIGQFELDAPEMVGDYRSFLLGFATTNEGVCRGTTTGDLAAGLPCEVDADCPGGTNVCAPGICSGGDQAGDGCFDDGDCTNGGTCDPCETTIDGEIFSGFSCSATSVIVTPAPILSVWGWVTLLVALAGVALVALRRRAAMG